MITFKTKGYAGEFTLKITAILYIGHIHYKELRSLRSLQLLRVWLSLAQSQGVMSWLGSVTPSVASARFARSLTWA